MLKVENYEVVGWEHTIRGMRNPKNSWDRMDSFMCKESDEGECSGKCPFLYNCPLYDNEDFYVIGPNDHKLMMGLAAGGPVHAKYRRMIAVYVDVTAPLYWWKEFDKYQIGVVTNSCSTMHKIHAKEFVIEDFSVDEYLPVWGFILEELNCSRDKFLETNDKKYWKRMIQLLPSSYNQKRTVMLNYEVLTNIYHSRKNHKLDEWSTFRKWIESLPYSEIITGETECPEE